MDRIVHVTGNIIAIGPHRVLQRCAVCGFKLVDIEAHNILSDGRPMGTWPIGRFLVCKDGCTPRLLPGLLHNVAFPPGACLGLVEDD